MGTASFTVQSLRTWKKALGGLSQEAFAAIRDVHNSDEKAIATSSLSLKTISRPAFLNLREKPSKQALVIHNIVRCGFS